MNVGFIVEHRGGRVSPSNLRVLSAVLEAANKHGYSRIYALVFGDEDVHEIVKEISFYPVDQIVVVTSKHFTFAANGTYAKAVEFSARHLELSVLFAVAEGRWNDVLPRCAEGLSASQISGVVSVHDDGEFGRCACAGRLIARMVSKSAITLVTIHSSAFLPSDKNQSPTEIVTLNVAVEPCANERIMSSRPSQGDWPMLSSADVVVTGGRGFRCKDDFEELLFPLAIALGGAIGASRAAVDLGFAPNNWQIGQTGCIVAPSLYIAIGVSGTLQHIAGIRNARCIVAINEDFTAPIHDVADISLVMNLYDVVPRLLSLLHGFECVAGGVDMVNREGS